MPMPRAALIVIDMLNPYAHEDADVLTSNVAPVVPVLAERIGSRPERTSSTSTTTTRTSPPRGDDLVRQAMHGLPAD